MHPTQLDPTGRRVGYLDDCLARGLWIDFYDPDGGKYGLPTYPYHCAPDGLLTIRQLRDKGLRPGGQPVAAQILWRRRKRLITAYLYRIDLAKPKATGHPRPTGGHRQSPGRPPHLPHLRHRKGLLHPALNRRMQRLHRPEAPMMAPPTDRRSGVNRSLTPKRRKRVTENDEYAAFLTRALRAYSRRIASGDIDALTAMATLAADLDHAMTEAITELRARHGYSWADIGTRLGITRQAAQQRWGTARPPPHPPVTTIDSTRDAGSCP